MRSMIILVAVLAFGATGARAQVTAESRVSGTFDVTLTPQPASDDTLGANVGRLTIDKQFHGGLAGVSKGEMLTAMTDVDGSAGYVAIEAFSGTLDGRTGTFVLQHSGTMNRGTPQLSITVVPDSGTGQLEGITGTMTIEITGEAHAYDFAYTLPDNP